MSRLDRDAIAASLAARLGATPDPESRSDLVAGQGRINVVASMSELDAALARHRDLGGYRWVAINAADLFGVSPKTIGSKVGIMDPTGKILKNADLPRPK